MIKEVSIPKKYLFPRFGGRIYRVMSKIITQERVSDECRRSLR
jgi:hypothetical protein